jgi:hypothetical protein
LASQSPKGTQSGVALHGALVSLTEEKLDTIKLFIEKFRQKHL